MAKPTQPIKKIALVGPPNVGKSVIFNCLTGNYAAVSNYPGTTVDVLRGYLKLDGKKYEVIDTPGMYSLLCLTGEERVTRYLLETEKPDIIVHVTDAKNIRRMLNLTLELKELGMPLILNLNMMDEAQKLGIFIDVPRLSARLGVPVATTAAVRKKGIGHLKKVAYEYLSRPPEDAHTPPGDAATSEKRRFHQSNNLRYEESLSRQAQIDEILRGVFIQTSQKAPRTELLLNWLGKITRQPLTGLPILMLVLYLGLYQFVGNFAAGYLTDYLNNIIFSEYLGPAAVILAKSYLPWESAQSLAVGEYGVFTLGLRYALAIILPIAGAFFLVFALLEDSGYLPRLAMLVDWLLKKIGLSGRAVIPLALGLGCGTMAVMASRTLETKRERRLAVFLLALTVPCSAQLGIVLALLSRNPAMNILWAGYMLFIFFLAGWLGNKALPGAPASFYMEIPPLRIPLAANVFKKAYTRMFWYFVEILPIFIAVSMVLWAADQFNAVTALINGASPLLAVLGLPPESARAFILGFFRRDYGAAGLYDLALSGVLSGGRLLVAAVALTLFVPCVAQLAVIIKEEGKLAAAAMFGLVSVIAFGAAFLMSLALRLGGIL